MFVHEKRSPKLLVTFCARVRLLTKLSFSFEKIIFHPNFLSHALHGWGFSPVWVCKSERFPKLCHILCKDEVSHQCEFHHGTISFELLVTFFARIKFLTSMFVHEKRSPKLLVTFCAGVRFPTKLSFSFEKISLHPNFLSHALHGWGFSPVWVCKWERFPKLFVTFFARIIFSTCCTIHL